MFTCGNEAIVIYSASYEIEFRIETTGILFLVDIHNTLINLKFTPVDDSKGSTHLLVNLLKNLESILLIFFQPIESNHFMLF